MAYMDSNLIATPGFVVKNNGEGQTLTMQLAPIGANNGGTYTQTGWRPVLISPFAASAMLIGTADASPYNVTPSVDDIQDVINALDPSGSLLPNDSKGMRRMRVASFINFIEENPVHVKAINLRAEVDTVLPSQIIVKTPNLYSGQMDRQVIDVASRKTAYQYQNGIITISDLDLFVCRNSVIIFNGSFTVSETYITDMELFGAKSLYVDLVIDYYISLERGLVNNVALLQTASGQATMAVENYENTKAELNPNVVVTGPLSEQGIANAQTANAYSAAARAAAMVQTKNRR